MSGRRSARPASRPASSARCGRCAPPIPTGGCVIDLPRQVGIALITEGPRVLVTQRRPGDSFPGYWEFPGGTREPGETLEECVVREMREELGVAAGLPAPLEASDCRWVTAPELAQYQFPPASDPLIDAVAARLRRAVP